MEKHDHSASGWARSWWSIWRDGPGSIAWAESDSNDWRNMQVIDSINQHWWTQYFENLLCYHYWRNMLTLPEDEFPQRVALDDFIQEPVSNGFMPIYLLQQEESRIVMKSASTMASLDDLQKYIRTDLPGTPLQICENIESQLAIFNMFGAKKHTVSKSIAMCTALKKQEESKKLDA